MQTTQLALLGGFTFAVQGDEHSIRAVYCADLLSWAMGAAPSGAAWCTVMGNVNAVAVASLTDAAVIVLCENAAPDEAMLDKARLQDINIVRTPLPVFEAGLSIARAAGLYPEAAPQ